MKRQRTSTQAAVTIAVIAAITTTTTLLSTRHDINDTPAIHTSVRPSARLCYLTCCRLICLAIASPLCGARIGRRRCHCCFIHYYLLRSLLLLLLLLCFGCCSTPLRAQLTFDRMHSFCADKARARLAKCMTLLAAPRHRRHTQQLRAKQVERAPTHTHTQKYYMQWHMIPIGSAVVTAAHVQCCDLQHSRLVIGGWHCVES